MRDQARVQMLGSKHATFPYSPRNRIWSENTSFYISEPCMTTETYPAQLKHEFPLATRFTPPQNQIWSPDTFYLLAASKCLLARVGRPPPKSSINSIIPASKVDYWIGLVAMVCTIRKIGICCDGAWKIGIERYINWMVHTLSYNRFHIFEWCIEKLIMIFA